MPLYLSEKEVAKLQAGAAPQEKRTRPSGPREKATGESTLTKAGWHNEYNSAMQLRFYRDGLTTLYYDDASAAVQAARKGEPMYLGWFDDNAKKDTPTKISEACAAYVERFKVRPNVVLLNVDDAPQVDVGVTVRIEGYIRKNNFWIGWE